VLATHNSLSGTLPPQIFMLPNLRRLHLDSNKIEGTIYSNISDSVLSKSKLEELNLAKNTLIGSFPHTFVNLGNLSKYYLFLSILSLIIDRYQSMNSKATY